MSTTQPLAPPHPPAEEVSGTDLPAEVVRREHLNREASVRALGLLFCLLGAVVLLATIYALGTGSNAGLEVRSGIWGIIDVTAYTVGIVATFAVGCGLLRLRRWARVPAIILCSIGLLRIPIGTLLFPYFLYLLLSAKGRRVLAPDYAAIVVATPHINRPKTIFVWTVLAVLIVIVGFVALRLAFRP
jgi:hypothetical protein